MIDTSLDLPTEPQAERLLHALANVLSQAGWSRFVTAPVVLPSADYFPDRWNRSARGAYLVTRRLMVYADLERPCTLEVYRGTNADALLDAQGREYPIGPDHTAAWFASSPEGPLAFGIDVEHLADDATLVASMCHEVAHAFRSVHTLEVSSRDVEEQLTDLTTVYLGFGVLTANGAFVMRTRYAGGHGIYAASGLEGRTFGYLGAGALAYLLAVQALVRSLRTPGATVELPLALAESLDTTPREAFVRAVEQLWPRRDELRTTLALPPPDQWPPLDDHARFLAPLTGDEGRDLDAEPPVARGARSVNRGERIFRVRRTLSVHYAVGGAVASILLGRMFAPAVVPMLILPAMAVGFAVGRTQKRYVCSDPACETQLTRSLEECPRCGGHIAGTIANASSRLDADEAVNNGTFRSLD